MSDLTNNELSLQASYQIEAMCLSLQSAAQSRDGNLTDALPYLVMGISQRIIDLNTAWVNNIADEDGHQEELQRTLRQSLFGISGGQHHESDRQQA